MNQSRYLCTLVPACLLLAAPGALLSQAPVRITGIYGDLHYVEEAGDVIGTEIIVSRTKTRYRVVFQEGVGEPGPVDTVEATVRGDSLFFQLPPDSVYQRGPNGTPQWVVRRRLFRGRVTAAALYGRLDGMWNPLALPRRARSARLR